MATERLAFIRSAMEMGIARLQALNTKYDEPEADAQQYANEAVYALVDTMKQIERVFAVGLRVEVYDGSGDRLMGYGTVVDFVTVYVRRISGGAGIHSLRCAETEFPGAQAVPENPKILMDDGTVRYGCQVWFRPAHAQGPTNPSVN